MKQGLVTQNFAKQPYFFLFQKFLELFFLNYIFCWKKNTKIKKYWRCYKIEYQIVCRFSFVLSKNIPKIEKHIYCQADFFIPNLMASWLLVTVVGTSSMMHRQQQQCLVPGRTWDMSQPAPAYTHGWYWPQPQYTCGCWPSCHQLHRTVIMIIILNILFKKHW